VFEYLTDLQPGRRYQQKRDRLATGSFNFGRQFLIVAWRNSHSKPNRYVTPHRTERRCGVS